MITAVERCSFGLEGKVYFKLFDCTIDVRISVDQNNAEQEEAESEALEYAEKCAEALNSLTDEAVDVLCRAVRAYCIDFIEEFGDFYNSMKFSVNADTAPREMLKCFKPTVFIVDFPVKEIFGEIIGYHVECRCDWEIEHGLEFTVRDGKIVYVGMFSDNTPWSRYYEDKPWNYINKGEIKND